MLLDRKEVIVVHKGYRVIGMKKKKSPGSRGYLEKHENRGKAQTQTRGFFFP
jgi:hypothetical protein